MIAALQGAPIISVKKPDYQISSIFIYLLNIKLGSAMFPWKLKNYNFLNVNRANNTIIVQYSYDNYFLHIMVMVTIMVYNS